MIFKPFNEQLLNISNILSEIGIFCIFSLIAINIMHIPDNAHDNIDTMLVCMVNFIMFTQMFTSLLIFAKNIIIIIRLKLKKKIVPVVVSTDVEKF